MMSFPQLTHRGPPNGGQRSNRSLFALLSLRCNGLRSGPRNGTRLFLHTDAARAGFDRARREHTSARCVDSPGLARGTHETHACENAAFTPVSRRGPLAHVARGIYPSKPCEREGEAPVPGTELKSVPCWEGATRAPTIDNDMNLVGVQRIDHDVRRRWFSSLPVWRVDGSCPDRHCMNTSFMNILYEHSYGGGEGGWRPVVHPLVKLCTAAGS